MLSFLRKHAMKLYNSRGFLYKKVRVLCKIENFLYKHAPGLDKNYVLLCKDPGNLLRIAGCLYKQPAILHDSPGLLCTSLKRVQDNWLGLRYVAERRDTMDHSYLTRFAKLMRAWEIQFPKDRLLTVSCDETFARTLSFF